MGESKHADKQDNFVIAIVGPTASGKSAVADEVALRLNTSVVSADAMQIYRGMDIGTAKTPPAERKVELLCIDLVEPYETYSAAQYQTVAHAAIDGLLDTRRCAVVCGGTGLYVRAALEDMDFAQGEQQGDPIREHYEQLAAELGPEGLHELLSKRDPQSAALIHPHNVRRVIRAFEMLERGDSYAQHHEHLHDHTMRHPTLTFGLAVERPVLYKRIDDRVDRMMELGLVDEVKGLMAQGMGTSLTARQAIGYKEIIDALEQGGKPQEIALAVDLIKRRSRRYAKRQLTWFKADTSVQWIEATQRSASEIANTIVSVAAAKWGSPSCPQKSR